MPKTKINIKIKTLIIKVKEPVNIEKKVNKMIGDAVKNVEYSG